MSRLIAILLALFAISACSPTVFNKGVPNLVQVDACVWRSGQPTTATQWQTLKGLGITHVAKLNFETEGSDDGARALGMEVRVLSIEPRGDLDFVDNITHTLIHPDPAVVNAADDYIGLFFPVTSTTGHASCPNGIVLVHCTHGQDRTGFEIGRYRVLRYLWTKAQAFSEMVANNFHTALHGIYDTWEDWQPAPDAGS
jgi:protein tyrosine/serine phosphatase